MFKALPPADGPLASAFGKSDSAADDYYRKGRAFDRGRHFNFYVANLNRAFGPGWKAAWLARVRQRLAAWGFNTAGPWSDAEAVAGLRMPYALALATPESAPKIVSLEPDVAALPDPFDPAFARAIGDYLDREIPARRDDRYLIGYFFDNELGWGRLPATAPARHYAAAVAVLAADGDVAAKRAFVSALKAKYQRPERLAAAWGVEAGDWERWERKPLRLPAQPSPALTADLGDLTLLLAKQYYSVVGRLLKQADPHHLFLGSRINVWIDPVVAACERFCDVVSFNRYGRHPAGDAFARLGALTKPALISEFHFGSTDGGFLSPGLVDVGTEAERGPAYRAYVEEAANLPTVVGVHWFQLIDQPVTGRLRDGENGHIGLVSVTDAPYEPFVSTVAQTNFDVLQRLRK